VNLFRVGMASHVGKRTSVTVSDIARAAGVSHTTVSRALHGRGGRISKQRRRQIRELAEKMNYQPKIAAQLLRAKKTGQLGMIVSGKPEEVAGSGFSTPFMVQFVQACEAQEIRYHIEFFTAGNDKDFRGLRQLTGGLVDGVIIAGSVDPAVRAWLMEQDQYPWVSVEEPADYCVLTASERGVYEAVEYLAGLGHRRIAFGCGALEGTVHRHAREGFEQAIRRFRFHSSENWKRHFAGDAKMIMAEARQWAGSLLADTERPTAVVCSDMRLARAVVYQAMMQDLRVPEDLSVIGYGIESDANKSLPYLTHIAPDYATVAAEAVNLLRKLISGDNVPLQTIRVPPKLVILDSVAPV